jgi:uncharacterized protein (DUF3084 family)
METLTRELVDNLRSDKVKIQFELEAAHRNYLMVREDFRRVTSELKTANEEIKKWKSMYEKEHRQFEIVKDRNGWYD